MTIIGIVLTVIGAVMLAYQSFTYTKEETVAEVGPLQVESQQKKTVPIPRVVGGTTLAAGVSLLVIGVVRRSRKN